MTTEFQIDSVDKFKQFLQTISPITDQEFADTIPFFTKQILKRNDFFVTLDMVCRHVAFVEKGTLRVFYLNDKAEEVTSCFCIEEHLTTSYKSFILQEPSKLLIQAIEDTELLTINYINLYKLYATYSSWQTIGRAITEHEYLNMEKYASVLNNETAKEKYMRLLKEQPTVIQKANVEHIASYLGVTRRTLSRIRKEIASGTLGHLSF